jgi:hypothetical protein
MFQSDPLAEAGAILFEKAEQRLAALLGKHGAQHRGGLPRPLQLELAERALLETAATIPGTFASWVSVIFSPPLRRAARDSRSRRQQCGAPGVLPRRRPSKDQTTLSRRRHPAVVWPKSKSPARLICHWAPSHHSTAALSVSVEDLLA